jgi:pilus assembly protein Flp/PilA
MNQLMNFVRAFATEDDGAQIVEYALIIAVVSIGLILLLMPAANGLNFQAFIDRVNLCLTTGPCA